MIEKNKIYILVFFIAVILGYYQLIRTDAPNYDLKLARHTSIIQNTIEYPYKYRLLNPFIAEVWFKALQTALPEKVSFIGAYSIQNILVFSFMLFCVFRFFRVWLDEPGAVISLLIFSSLVPLSLTGYDVLGDMTTAGIMALGFTFINTQKIKYLYPLIFISAFNELQLILLIMFYFFSDLKNIKNKNVWINSILLTVTFIAAYAIIFSLRGGAASSGDVNWYFTKDAAFNIAHKDWIPLWILMIAPLSLFAYRGLKFKPLFLKNSATIVLPLFYFGAFFFIARLREIDKALTIFIILIPLAVYTLFPKHIKSIAESRKGTMS